MSSNSLSNSKSHFRRKSSSITKRQSSVLPLDVSPPSKISNNTSANCETRPIVSYLDEMVDSFFVAMLEHVIDNKEICEEPPLPPSANFRSDTFLIEKDFKDLIDNDLVQQEVVSVNGSHVSLASKTKKLGSKRTSLIAKRNSHSSSLSSSGSLGKKKKHIKSSSILPKISETNSTVQFDTPEFHEDLVIGETWRVKDSQEYVTITFKNGNVYEGPLRNQLFHGEGLFFWNDGTIYMGNFENGEIRGLGKMIYHDMSTYYGNFFNGRPHGLGAFFMAHTRTLYSGNWAHGKKQGMGWLYYSENNWYDGEWQDDCRRGFGIRLYRNCTKYTGMWEDGFQHGNGACSFSNGDFYRGEWREGEIHGYGEYTWNAFFNKSLTFPVENIYQGLWSHGMRDGFGHLYFGLEHGARLLGFWVQNFKHGMGIVINSNGDVVERNPLFCNDKPVHLSDSDNAEFNTGSSLHHFSDRKEQQYMLSSINIGAPPSTWLLRANAHEACSVIINGINAGLVTEPFLQSVTSYRSLFSRGGIEPFVLERGESESTKASTIQKIDRLQDFPEERFVCNPLVIHTRAAPETLNLSFYVKKHLQEAKDQVTKSSASRTFSQWFIDHDLPNDPGSHESVWQLTYDHEMNNLRNVIWHNTKILHTVYEMYANISNHPDAPSRKCTLIRLYLWQLYRDLEIYKHGISLYDTDIILLENPSHCLETDHYAFERIYYWQFLWSLIGVSWKIQISKKNKVEEPYQLQSLYTIFEEFLKETVYPKAGNHKGPCLFEFKDLLPIMDVITLYENVGPLLTAREFLNKCCCKKQMVPSCHLQNFGDNSFLEAQYGVNAVAVGQNFIYILDKKEEILTQGEPDTSYPLEIDKFFKTLQVFRHICPHRLINCLALACPIIKKNGVIVNMEVKLTFLEFYETLIYCAYKSALLANLKERSKNVMYDDKVRARYEKDKGKKVRRDCLKKRIKK